MVRFAEGQTDTLAKLRSAVEDSDAKGVRLQAHALAGAGGNLGAEDLHRAAKALEQAASNGHSDTIQERFRDVNRAFRIVRESILENLPAETRKIKSFDRGPAPATGQLTLLLDNLLAYLDDFDPVGAEEVTDHIRASGWPDHLGGEYEKILRQVGELQYEQAREAIAKLKIRLHETVENHAS